MADELNDRLKKLVLRLKRLGREAKILVYENMKFKGLGHVHQFTYDGSKMLVEKTETASSRLTHSTIKRFQNHLLSWVRWINI